MLSEPIKKQVRDMYREGKTYREIEEELCLDYYEVLRILDE